MLETNYQLSKLRIGFEYYKVSANLNLTHLTSMRHVIQTQRYCKTAAVTTSSHVCFTVGLHSRTVNNTHSTTTCHSGVTYIAISFVPSKTLHCSLTKSKESKTHGSDFMLCSMLSCGLGVYLMSLGSAESADPKRKVLITPARDF